MKNTSNQRTSKERGEGGKAIPTDHSIGSETMAIIEESEKNCTTNISFLSADAVRWINKRQHASNGVVGARVMPARALQLREIFQGLDFDNSGSIDISELKEAIEYVAKSSAAGDTPMLKDPEKLSEFFVAMDTNHDGTVDFNEFLVAMTSQSSEDSTTNKLKEAFFEFANHHRRQKILDFVNSSTPSDIEKYHSMKELFKIQYFKEEQLDLSTAEKLQRVQAVAAKQMKEIRTKEYLEQRKVEQIRSREALLYFNDARRTGPPTICCDTIPHLLDTEVTESEVAMKKAEKEIRNKFAGFSLHMEKTFTSEGMVTKGMQSAPPPEPVRMRAKTEALKAKSDKFLMKNLPPILPPVSVKARASTLTPA